MDMSLINRVKQSCTLIIDALINTPVSAKVINKTKFSPSNVIVHTGNGPHTRQKKTSDNNLKFEVFFFGFNIFLFVKKFLQRFLIDGQPSVISKFVASFFVVVVEYFGQ